MLILLDWLLTAVHVAVIVGFVALWLPRRTARLHGWLVLLTAFSWLVLGSFEGFGYCVLTDLEWRVKRARGIRHLPGSFIKYAADFVTGRNLSPSLVDSVAAATFVFGVLAAIFRYRQRSRAAP